jgi:hypothetical protein
VGAEVGYEGVGPVAAQARRLGFIAPGRAGKVSTEGAAGGVDAAIRGQSQGIGGIVAGTAKQGAPGQLAQVGAEAAHQGVVAVAARRPMKRQAAARHREVGRGSIAGQIHLARGIGEDVAAQLVAEVVSQAAVGLVAVQHAVVGRAAQVGAGQQLALAA